MNPWLPKLIECLADYDQKKFFADLIAGLTVGLVALPLAMAFAISSGVPPQAGIYCAVVTGFLISALGGSKMQIGGPTGAFVVVISGIIGKYGIEGLYVCTLMAGIILILLGVTGMGAAVRFIPRPVVVGFTNGIAMLIASTQIKDFLGLRMEKVPSEFLLRMEAIGVALPTVSWQAAALGVGSVALILFCAKYVKRVPGYIAALFLGTVIAWLLQLPVETIGSKFGGIPSGLPHFHLPRMRWDLMLTLLSPALTVAMLGAIESLMSAVVSDRMSGDQHKPNVELIAQGVANIVSPMFGGLPATGAIARTATNIRAGAKTPVAGMIHALTLLAVLIFAAPLARFVPMPVLAGILFVVSWNMGEWKEIPHLLHLTKADIAVWAVTFLLTVVADLTLAVEFGMILAALLFIRKVAVTTTISQVTHDYIAESRVHILQDKMIPDYVTIFRIHGPFLFGATEKMHEITDRVEELPETVILRLRNMPALDATGLQALEELAGTLKKTGRNLVLCGAREQPLRLMQQAHFEDVVGAENLCPSIASALDRAGQLHRMVATSDR